MSEHTEDRNWHTLIVCLAVIAVSALALGMTRGYLTDKAAFENGYERATLAGEDMAHWVKAKTDSTKGEK